MSFFEFIFRALFYGFFFYPESFIILSTCILINFFMIYSVFYLKNNYNLITMEIFKTLIIFAVLVALWYIILLHASGKIEYLDFSRNTFFSTRTYYLKTIMIVLHTIYLVSLNYLLGVVKKIYVLNAIRFFNDYYTGVETILLQTLLMFGITCILTIESFFGLFMCLEFQAFLGYILIALKLKERFSIEASLKYFIVSVVSLIMYAIACYIVYKDFGLKDFPALKEHTPLILLGETEELKHITPWLYFEFILAQFLFIIFFFIKLGIAPFHLWMVDVYAGGAPFIMYYFFLIPKFTIFISLYIIVTNMFYFGQPGAISTIFYACCLMSITFGSINALSSFKIKKFLIYSSISNFGFLTLLITSINIENFLIIILYICSYSISIISIFIFIIYYENRKQKEILTFKNFFGDNDSSGPLQLALFVQLLSGGSLPPFLLFFSKSFILLHLLELFFNINIIFIIFCIFSVFSIFYYLRIIRYIILNKLKHNYTVFIPGPMTYGFVYFQFVLMFCQILIIFFSDFIICYLNYLYYMYL